MRIKVFGIRVSLIYAVEVIAVMNNAGRARIDQVTYTSLFARPNHISGALYVRAKEIPIGSPHINFRCSVKNPRCTVKDLNPVFWIRRDIYRMGLYAKLAKLRVIST
jgi:hypothetical protein